MLKDKKAFTLVEIVVAVAILGLAAVGIYNFFTSAQKQSGELLSKSSVGQEAQKYFRMLRRDLFYAREILFPGHATCPKKSDSFMAFRNSEDEVIMYYLHPEEGILYRKNLTTNQKPRKIAENIGEVCYTKMKVPHKYGDLNYITAAVGFFQESRDKSAAGRTKHRRYYFTSLLLNKDTTDFYTHAGDIGKSINRDRILQEFY